MDKLILFANPNNDVLSVIRCDEAKVDEVLVKAIPPNAVGLRITDAVDLDRTFRSAWEDDGLAVKVNLPKAQAIHMDRIRAMRNAELANLDVPQMTAISKSDLTTAAAIETTKQKLRDLPTTFDLTVAKTADELKALWPVELPKE